MAPPQKKHRHEWGNDAAASHSQPRVQDSRSTGELEPMPEKRVCQYCKRKFRSGRALGGHIRVHSRNQRKTNFTRRKHSRRTDLLQSSAPPTHTRNISYCRKDDKDKRGGGSDEIIDLCESLSGCGSNDHKKRRRTERKIIATAEFADQDSDGDDEMERLKRCGLSGSAHRISCMRIYKCNTCDVVLPTIHAVLCHVNDSKSSCNNADDDDEEGEEGMVAEEDDDEEGYGEEEKYDGDAEEDGMGAEEEGDDDGDGDGDDDDDDDDEDEEDEEEEKEEEEEVEVVEEEEKVEEEEEEVDVEEEEEDVGAEAPMEVDEAVNKEAEEEEDHEEEVEQEVEEKEVEEEEEEEEGEVDVKAYMEVDEAVNEEEEEEGEEEDKEKEEEEKDVGAEVASIEYDEVAQVKEEMGAEAPTEVHEVADEGEATVRANASTQVNDEATEACDNSSSTGQKASTPDPPRKLNFDLNEMPPAED